MEQTSSNVYTKLEFVVDLKRPEQIDQLKNTLSNQTDIRNVEIDVSNKRLLLDSTMQASKVQKLIENSLQTDAVLLGTGNHSGAAAVSALYSNLNRPFERRVHGLVRFIQADEDRCIIEGTVDGLTPNSSIQINIHQYGDLSDGCDSCGDYYDVSRSPTDKSQKVQPIGRLSDLMTNNDGSVDFRLINRSINVSDIIGRSFVIQQTSNSQRVACGIIARSAGLFENTKRLCTCSGATLWEERREAKQKFQ